MEKETQVRPVMVRLMCDDCKTEMSPGILIEYDPVQHKHTCPKCNSVIISEDQYPFIRYIEMSDIESFLSNL